MGITTQMAMTNSEANNTEGMQDHRKIRSTYIATQVAMTNSEANNTECMQDHRKISSTYIANDALPSVKATSTKHNKMKMNRMK
jgi:hypothetical protein